MQQREPSRQWQAMAWRGIRATDSQLFSLAWVSLQVWPWTAPRIFSSPTRTIVAYAASTLSQGSLPPSPATASLATAAMADQPPWRHWAGPEGWQLIPKAIFSFLT